jgi:hypothetical protein
MKDDKIYSNNSNEYFVFFVDTTERKTNRKEKKEQKMSEKNLFNIKEFSTYRTLYYFSYAERIL